MSYTENYIVDTYSALFEGLSPISKIKLIESLAKSLKTEKKISEKKFYNAFGAFASTKSAEEIIADIKLNRSFREKEIKF